MLTVRMVRSDLLVIATACDSMLKVVRDLSSTTRRKEFLVRFERSQRAKRPDGIGARGYGRNWKFLVVNIVEDPLKRHSLVLIT